MISYYRDRKLKRREYHKSDDTSVVGKCYDEKGNEIHFTSFYVMPIPSYSITDYLIQNLKYPEIARTNNITGRVIVKFVVDEKGKIGNAEVLSGIGGGCDQEALRVILNMPPWKPGKQDDVPSKVYFTQPITFNLE